MKMFSSSHLARSLLSIHCKPVDGTTKDCELRPEDQTLAVALERLGGRALRTGELEWLLGIVLRVCETVSVHGRGLICCDLEPRNVLLGNRGQVHVTREHGRGTAAYMAPEQAWGRRADH